MKKLLSAVAVLFYLVLSTNLYASPLSLEEIQEAACRVTNYSAMGSPQSLGSGTVVKEKDGKYYVLTNGHVVNGGAGFAVEFFKSGYVSKKVPAKLVWKNYVVGSSIDVAIISVDKSTLGGYIPRIIKLAPTDYTAESKTLIRGAGCPNGAWEQCWRTRIIANGGNTISFTMPPLGGQSGSGILTEVQVGDEEETRLIGIVTWRMPGANGEYGAGVSNTRINEILTRKAKPDRLATSWDFALCAKKIESQTPIKRCGCPLSLDDHIVIYNKLTMLPRRNASGGIPFYCPTQSLTLFDNEATVRVADCPDGWCPWKGPNQKPKQGPNTNPDTSPPNIFGEDEEPESPDDPKGDSTEKLLKENAELKAALDFLNKDKTAIAKENTTLRGMNDELVGKIKSAVANGEKLSVEKTAAEKKAAEEKATADKLTVEKETVEKEAAKLAAEKATIEENVKKLAAEKADAEKETKELHGMLSTTHVENAKLEDEKQTLVSENKSLGDKLRDLLATVEDKKTWISGIVGNENATWTERILMLLFGSGIGAGLWHKYIYPKLLERGKIPAWIIQRIGKRVLRKKLAKFQEDDEAVYNTVEEDYDGYVDEDALAESLVDTSPTAGVKKKLEVNHVVSGEVQHTVCYPEKAIKQLKEYFANLEREGETDSAKMWALKAGLYRDAVDQLRKKNLTIDGDIGDGTKALATKDAADIIDNWVLDKLYTRIQNNDLHIDFFSKNNLYTQAYTGTLYKEAIDSLRNGRLEPPTLNHVVIAGAIEGYVKKHYLEKVFPAHDRCGK